MRRAIELALESEREGNIPVGAVITLDGEIIGEGHSAVLQPEYHPGRHAEVMALRDVDNELWPRAGEMTCYSTLEPCVMCAGTLLLHGIGRVVFGAVDRDGGAGCVLDALPPYYDDGGVYEWEGPLMPRECDPLYERTDEIFESLPVGRSQWTESSEGDEDPIRSRLDLLAKFRSGEEVGLRNAREALVDLQRRLQPDELHELVPYARSIFEQGGYLKDYRRLQRIADRVGAPDPFDEVEETVRRQLPDVWIRTAIERGRVESAVDCWFEKEGHTRLRLCADELVQACSEDDIDIIVSCRMAVVEYLVGRRARRHYRRACTVLRRLRDELDRAGEPEYWRAVIDDLRDRYDNLPAFMDEVRKAEL